MRSSSSCRVGLGLSVGGDFAASGLAGATAAGTVGAAGDGTGLAAATGVLAGLVAAGAALRAASAICRAALNTCRQAPQRTAPWAAPSWARLTRKRVRQLGHWAT